MTPKMERQSTSSSSSYYGYGFRSFISCALFLLLLQHKVSAWTNYNCNDQTVIVSRAHHRPSTALYSSPSSSSRDNNSESSSPSSISRQSTITNRRENIQQLIQSTTTSFLATTALVQTQSILPASAYTPDSDPLRESLYLMSRVQEATVQQERFVNRATQQDVLKSKMKLTLRLVEKNYRLLDQITFCSEYVTPSDKVVEATTAGYEAAEALQNAIDYVNSDLKSGEFEKGQKEYLTANLSECRECLFDFFSYMPKDGLEGARKRVEEENVANRDEFDGDSDAGVYNPVILPWKNR
mmetsp:Transcript_24236/g.52279  ORF Transcript_24236/g.52279 Transcript_24236/m.52279 type:complete len:297 (+) Transcript_24236:162-1052(+)